MKIIVLGLVLLCAFTGKAQAYYGKDSAVAKYQRGEISADQYIDSLGVPSKAQSETTVYHSDGGKTIIKPQSSGHGTIYHSNGSKSVYYCN